MRRLSYLLVFLVVATAAMALTPYGWGTKMGGDVPGIEGGIYHVPDVVCNNNGFCDEGEREELCTKDCQPQPKCFNHWCEYGETPLTCPYDCSIMGNNCFIDPDIKCPFGWVRGPSWQDEYSCERIGNCIEVCNRNGKCDEFESVTTCPDDCSAQAVQAMQQSYESMLEDMRQELDQVKKARTELVTRESKIQGLTIQAVEVIPDTPIDQEETAAYAFFLFFSTLGLIGVMSFYSISRRFQDTPQNDDIPPAAATQQQYVPYLRSLFMRAEDHEILQQQLLSAGWHPGVVRRARRGP
ncbi:MAG: hypothetical protein QF486_00380 [Candidatus Woesearchaeota archaeon]|nr:hypothetical protein [Candidatus Woesearchaeota archaeon]MDP7181320.1 hypothetical protein [Candidatus Woesearchaeota archaeon]MDP7198061.1 hypothetical protein [Candidatus Woesearchaeota archaeon]MDP7466895.1 hypothetical protein [Candidatus Woesearchaeota archaeon]MDP7647330.1 hypothetical protein [Candidatus Woesearchaeota archaeon]